MAQRIRVQDFGAAMHRKMAQRKRLVEAAAVETCAQAEVELVARTDAAGLVDQGEYRQGWHSRRIDGGAEIGNDAPHADAIEYGRRPGRPGPPIEPIRRWVERKIQPPPQQLEQIAWLVQRSIHHRGSEPNLILTSYQPRLKQLFKQNIRRRLKR